ncbi:Myc-type, basic helix-loop-helix (bHLH) domain containing protein [Trema orientale]|uniref:Myc-type, basic helix-loop-helix (BHLH) domain containing protein n=1 Tax=Trema orientale TaxID=63057 RepID=A0A2P5BPY5_TREOI|nr:Myc-type, basic helix-loop-helix (bHLH) domain containing protein [Trema orientale]
MQHNHQFYPGKKAPPLEYQVGNNHMHVPVASAFGAVLPPPGNHLKHFHGVEFQPSEVCPKNFIIFDQTDHRSQIVFHPAIAHKFGSPGLNMDGAYLRSYFGGRDRNDEGGEISSPLKEDSDDIDALLSLEEEEQDEYDEEEISTARTYGNYGSSSPESCSNYGLKTKKNTSSSSIQKSSGSGSSGCNSERKRQRMKKMVKALRGIVPGGNEMTTVTVLDEAVQYLKSLKVEVQKLGVGNQKH